MYDLLCEYFSSDAVEGVFILLLAVPLIGWRIAVALEGKSVPGFWKTYVQRLGRAGVSLGILLTLYFAYAQQKEEQQQAQQQAVVEVFTSISEALGSLGETLLRNWLTPEEKKSRLLPVGLATNDTAWVAESQCVTSQVREAWQRVPIRRAAFRQTLPFPVSIAGNSYEEVFISSSGVIGFDAPKGSELTREMPYEEAADHVYLALLWGRIDFKPRLGSKMWCGVKEDGNFVASYDTVFIDGDTNAVARVQVEFIANGDMILRYADLPPCATNAHVAGFQNLDGGWSLPFDNIRSNTALYLKSFGPLDLTVQDSDTDGDGISDYYELYPTNSVSLTDPCNTDSDGDGLMDGEEVFTFGTDPGAFSSDASGTGDLWRVLGGLSPSDAPYTNAPPSGSVGILTVTTVLEGTTTNGGAVLRIADQYIPVLFGTTLVSRIAVPRDATNLFILARGLNCDNAIAHITVEASTFTKIRDPSGVFGWSFALSPSCVTASGAIVMPSYTITPSLVCFHSPTSSICRITSADPDIYFVATQGFVREYTPTAPYIPPNTFTNGTVQIQLASMDAALSTRASVTNIPAHLCNPDTGLNDEYPDGEKYSTWCKFQDGEHVWADGYGPTNCPCLPVFTNAFECICSGDGRRPCECAHATRDPKAMPVNADQTNVLGHAALVIGGTNDLLQVTVPEGTYRPCPLCACASGVPSSADVYRQTSCIEVTPGTLTADGAFSVAGMHPSTNFADTVFMYKEADYSGSTAVTRYTRKDYTVLGTAVYPTDPGHSVSNWFVGCNITNALTLWTGVALPSDTGEVTLSVTVESGTPSPQLYVYNRTAQSNELLVTQGQLTFTQNLGDWRDTYCDTNGHVQVYLLCASGGVARVTHSYETYSGQPYDISTSSSQPFAVMRASICSVMLNEDGRLILGTDGQADPAAELGWEEVDASSYNPLSERGLLRMDNVSALLGGIQEWVTFIETQTGAELTITKADVAGYMTWDLEYAGMTNGMPYYTWSDGSNSYVRVAVTNSATTVNTTNGVMGLRDLHVTIKDELFNYSTNEWNGTLVVYRDVENASDYFSNYTMSDPREDVGLPPFSDRNALVVRFDPMGMTGDFVCTATDEDDNETEIPLTQQSDGTYVSALIVPISELDGEADLGFLSNVSAVRLKLANKNNVTGWQYVNIDIKALGEPALRIKNGKIRVKEAMLLSGLVTDEGKANYQNDAVVEAGAVAVKQLHYGVTPIFSPEISTVNSNLLKHSVWMHTGHGHWKTGIIMVRKVNNQYRKIDMMATDITRSNLRYDLVFMNTCYSTDTYYRDIRVLGNPVGWYTNKFTLATTAVMDIGTKLNAKNYIGWDCEAHRTVASDCLVWLMQYLDTKADGTTRSVNDAVNDVKEKMDGKLGIHQLYMERLRLVTRDDSVILDLNKKKD
jgi:hypothetical protein